MVSQTPCTCEDKSTCGGLLTLTEIHMHELDPRETAQRYHEIMDLFGRAFHEGWQ